MMLRAADDTDAQAICAIMNQVIRETSITFKDVEKTPADVLLEIKKAQTNDCPFLVIETDGVVQGYATYSPFRAGSGYRRTMEHSVAISPTAQRAGFGYALMSALEEQARANKVGSLIGAISAENSEGLAFHSALGFVEVGRIPMAGWKFSRWIDLVLVQKALLTPKDKS